MSSHLRLWDEGEEQIVRFVLGDVSDAERAEIENRVILDSEFLDEVLAASDDVIHAYLKDSLSPDDRRRFETHFLSSPRRRRRVEFVRSLVATAKEASSRERSVRRGSARSWPWLVAAAVVLSAGLLVLRSRDDGGLPAPLPATTAPFASLATPSPAASSPVPVRLVHLPRATAEPVEIPIGDEAATVRLAVPIPEDRHPTYDAVIRDATGAAVWRAVGLVASGRQRSVVLDVPAPLLLAGVYALHVDGEPLRVAPRSAPAATAIRYSLKVTRGVGSPQRQSP